LKIGIILASLILEGKIPVENERLMLDKLSSTQFKMEIEILFGPVDLLLFRAEIK